MAKVTLTCSTCGKTFQRYRSQIRGRVFCSHKCHSLSEQAKELDESVFRFDTSTYTFEKPHPFLGNYDGVKLTSHSARKPYNYRIFEKGIHDELTAYLYGVILTDGAIILSEEKRSNALVIKMKDKDIIEIISNALKKKAIVVTGGKYHMLQLRNNYLVHDLMALGCRPNKTENANYPLIPDELDKHFIRGCFDGDGSWVTSQKQNRYTVENLRFFGNDLLLYGIYRKIKQHLGVVPQKVQYPREYKMRSFCRITYGQFASYKIRDWLYEGATYYGRRKYAKSMGV